MKHHGRRLLAATGAALILLVGGLGLRADALTSWRTFGSGSATGRGSTGWPGVTIESTTRANPEQLRLVINGPRVGKASVYWSLDCWNENNYDYEYASGSFKTAMPRTVDLSNKVGGVRKWQYCDLYASVDYYKPGTIKLALQARY